MMNDVNGIEILKRARDAGVEFKREFGEFILYMRRPGLDAFQSFGQLLGFHGFAG